MKVSRTLRTGFDANMVDLLHRRLAGMKSDMPYRSKPELAEVKFWCRPELVCEVEYLVLTPDRALRVPAFQRLREDKIPMECRFPESPR